MARKKIGQLLVECGELSDEKLEVALNVQNRTHERLGIILERLGFARTEIVARVVAAQYGHDFISPEQISHAQPDVEAIQKLTLDFCRQNVMLPATMKGTQYLLLSDVLNTRANDRALSILGRRRLALSTRPAISTAIETYAFGGRDGEKIVESAREAISAGEINEVLGYLLGKAVLMGASDIHIEPTGPVSIARFRIDGVLEPEISLPRERHDNLVNVLFGKSGIDLSDFHRLRDGRFSFGFAGRTLDVRFASSPTVEGPMVVLRILDDTRSLTRLQDLGYTEWNKAIIQDLIRHPHGVILMVGPTGSGKTTTLYSVLSQLNDAMRKILTIEDPVEIKLPSVQQVQVNIKAGVTFANAIRGFLRQDPDVILVGEIRDEETAREAFRAANTGHLVLTTLHANSAVEAVSRLVDLGLESYRVAEATLGVVAQRLLRRLCTVCRVPAPLPAMPGAFGRGPGCEDCRAGYVSRSVVAEVLCMNDDLRDMVHKRAATHEVLARARALGMKTLLDNGRWLVEQGATTVEEVERVLGRLDADPRSE